MDSQLKWSVENGILECWAEGFPMVKSRKVALDLSRVSHIVDHEDGICWVHVENLGYSVAVPYDDLLKLWKAWKVEH